MIIFFTRWLLRINYAVHDFTALLFLPFPLLNLHLGNFPNCPAYQGLKGGPPLIWFFVSLWAWGFFYKFLQVAYICTIAKRLCVIRTQNKSFCLVFYP